MRHATIFSKTSLIKAALPALIASVVLLASAGLRHSGFQSLWTFLVDPPVIYLGTVQGAPPQCHCLDNATSLTNGQFADTLTIESDPGEVWTITAVTGLFSASSPAPPAAPIAIPVGTVIPETAPGSGIYRLAVRHVDAMGFTVTVDNGIGDDLSIASTCYYPNPQIVNLSGQYCTSGLPVTLQGNAGGAAGTGVFTINGVPATALNPVALGPGTYTVTYTFNAGAGTPNNPNDPACSASISQQVQVINPPTISGVAFLNVPMNNQCFAVITPDMILAGPYPCPGDYRVTVLDVPGNPIGDTVSSIWVGFTLRAIVTTVAGNFQTESMLTFFDDIRPDITCPPTATTGVVSQMLQTVNGTLANTDSSIVLSNYTCFVGQTNPAMGAHRYDTYTFTVNTADNFILELDPQFGRAVGVLYQGAFNPASPCMNVIDMANDGSLAIMPDSVIRISANLVPGQTYTLLTSSQQPGATGPYTWRIYSNGPGLVNNISFVTVRDTFELVCNDTDSIFNNPASLSLTGSPIATDNCGTSTVTFTDTRQNNGNCGDQIITRTFRVTDASGNTRTCAQTIRVRKPRLSDLRFPPASTVIECSVGFQTTPDGNPHPSATGYPYIETAFGIYPINQVFCNLLAYYQDDPRISTSGPNVYSFLRRWTVFDECTAQQFVTYNQIISVDDFSPPIISCPVGVDQDGDGIPDPPVFSTENTACTAVVQAMAPQIVDNCTAFTYMTEIITDIQVPIIGPQGQVIGFTTQTQILDTILAGAPPFVSGVPIGNHRFRYTATDSRGNMSRVECPFSVRDDIQPTAVCDDNLVVSIGSNFGRVFAQDVNEGSSDNCGIATIEVRRRYTQNPETCATVTPYYSPWGPHVEITCCDIGTQVQVELRVTDLFGNINVCVSMLTVSDNTRPVCMAPPAMSVGCDALPDGFNPSDTTLLQSLFGAPISVDNCTATTEELNPIVNIGDCGNGSIIRRFRARDLSGNISSNTCQQVITINLVHNYEIRFPKDASAECGVPPIDTLIVRGFGCENMAISTVDQIFTASGGACYKIFRTYRVINWCEYNGQAQATVINRDEDCDTNPGDEEVWVLRRPNQTYIDRNNNHADNIPAAGTRGLSCGGPSNPAGYWRTIPSVGFWEYTQVIKVFDTTRPTAQFTPPAPVCTSGANCTASVSVPFTIEELCSPNDVSVQVFLDAFSDGVLDNPITGSGLASNYPNYLISGTFPIGSHRFVVNLSDGCGNTNSITIPFQVIDCVGPTPTCIAGIAAPLMLLPPGTDADGDGDIDIAAVTLQAVNFLAGPLPSDCSVPFNVSVNRAGQTPNPSQSSLVFTCDDIGTQIIEIYVWDSAFNPTRVQPDGTVGGPNYGSCQTFVIVQANGQVNCQISTATMGMIAGSIFTENNQPVQGVNVALSGYMSQSTMTENDGLYFAEDLPSGESYTVTPINDQHPINGVSTFDLILVTKHILGVQLLDSPYKLIAADANNSKTITTLDVITIRRLILGLTANFPGNTSWRFVDASYVFPNPANPWSHPFPEVINVGDLQGNMNNRNFIAIKVGDVNGNAILSADDVEDRSIAGTFTLYSNALDLVKGQEVSAPITARNWQGIEGFQMTIEFDADKLEFLDVVYGVIGAEHIGLNLVGQGMLTVSWNRQGSPFANGADPAEEGEALFWLSFRAKTGGPITSALALSSRYTRAEAYDPQGDLLDVVLQFERAALSEDRFELYQNEPNPFNGQTMISFRLPEDDFFTLRIHDTNGKVLKEQRGYFEAGLNKMWVHAADLPSSGVLYYTLTSGTHAATRKMVVIK